MLSIKKLCIGTAQFGMDYGISNELGIVDNAEINRILNYSQKHNIRNIDTSSNYGLSEKNLGSFFANNIEGYKWNITTKVNKHGE